MGLSQVHADGKAAAPPQPHRAGGFVVSVVQLVERKIVDLVVVGSSPIAHPSCMLFAIGDKKCVPDSWVPIYERTFQLIDTR